MDNRFRCMSRGELLHAVIQSNIAGRPCGFKIQQSRLATIDKLSYCVHGIPLGIISGQSSCTTSGGCTIITPICTHSSKTRASLTFPARYGDPPLSGWFASINCRWASFKRFEVIGSLVTRYDRERGDKGNKETMWERRKEFVVRGARRRVISLATTTATAVTHLSPSTIIASDRSILPLNPPLTHAFAPLGWNARNTCRAA